MEDFSRLYQRDRLELDRGTLTSEEYWARILEASGVQTSAELIARIEEEDSLGWTRINERVVSWSRELRAAGYATAILSNMPFDKLAYMRKNPAFDFIDEFPVTVFSCNHRVVKPEAAIYRLCLDLLVRAPEPSACSWTIHRSTLPEAGPLVCRPSSSGPQGKRRRCLPGHGGCPSGPLRIIANSISHK